MNHPVEAIPMFFTRLKIRLFCTPKCQLGKPDLTGLKTSSFPRQQLTDIVPKFTLACFGFEDSTRLFDFVFMVFQPRTAVRFGAISLQGTLNLFSKFCKISTYFSGYRGNKLRKVISNSDQHQISLCNINAFTVRVFMRIKDMIAQHEFRWRSRHSLRLCCK